MDKRLIIVGVIAIILGFIGGAKVLPSLGSVAQGGTYTFASTRNSAGTALTSPTTLVTGVGEVGQVTITGAAAGAIFLYDATTSDVTLRTGQTATSALKVISIPASTVAGTYTFDGNFYKGILYVGEGTVPTSTITYRP